ncbi:hypothetical protein [Kingella oralis]|nr:hypothetical protein [Kingella oralis]QMT43562.1 hypothetical protein H3L93_04310 [Kingella oralis]
MVGATSEAERKAQTHFQAAPYSFVYQHAKHQKGSLKPHNTFSGCLSIPTIPIYSNTRRSSGNRPAQSQAN